MMKYIVIRVMSLQKLVEQVQHYIDVEGYEPLAGITVVPPLPGYMGSDAEYLQAMVKK